MRRPGTKRYAIKKLCKPSGKVFAKELAASAKRFPDEFNKTDFPIARLGMEGMKNNRPQIVAAYTKDFVYERLAPGILDELETRNPNTEGRRRNKHHQWLSDEVGHPRSAQHLFAVIVLIHAARNWNDFKFLIDQTLTKKGTTPMPCFTE